MKRVWVAVLAAAALTGCSQSDPDSQPEPPQTSAASIDVTIAGGEVTPMDQRVEGKVGHEIVVTVNSDAADEIHVHSIPEHSFPVAVGERQQFRFTADVPGSVDVELHEADVTVATVLVRP